ncbi:MAG: PilZ domain-containing protein [Candidatus Eremiobacteraeota bacterium]|nr:PilZ domain-containing protein [Candidatus Eremiobacteraeota bacterium]
MWQLFAKKNTTPADGAGREEPPKVQHISMILMINARSSIHREQFRMMTDNISTKAIRFASDIELSAGERVEMDMLLLVNLPRITMKGEVLWCRKNVVRGKMLYECALRITELRREDQPLLERYIERYRTGEKPVLV